MNAFRIALHDRLHAITKPIASSPLFPWVNIVAYANLATLFFGLQSDRPFEIARVGGFGWFAGSLFLLNAFLIAAQLIRSKRRR